MRIHLIVIGTLKERYFSAAYEEYAKRLSRYADVRLTELKEERLPEKPGDKSELREILAMLWRRPFIFVTFFLLVMLAMSTDFILTGF